MRTSWPSWVAGLCVLMGGAFASFAELQGASPADQRLEAELAAGEFAPALTTARGLTDPVARDDALVRVIQAQIGTGAVGGMTQTGMIAPTGLPAPGGAQGGANAPDFQGLIDLVTGTIAPTTWSEVGGQGAIRPFPGGVLADPSGLLKRIATTGFETEMAAARLAALDSGVNRDARQTSSLRKISLSRLDRAIRTKLLLGQPLDDEFWTLAGLQRVRYVMFYPQTNDVIVAGPAGDWRLDAERRLVSHETGRPLTRLDDLLTLWRAAASGELKFGCSITPTATGLARTQQFANESAKRPLRPGERESWLNKLREQLGRQNVEVFGIPAESRVAQVIVEADYRMKLVGLGLEEGTLDMTNYLDSIVVKKGESPPLDVLRWWFTLNYQALAADPARQIFELRGPGVKVLSENELLAENGQRIHTGTSATANRQFAASFTQHFSALAAKYPVYAELQNIFDLSLVVALLQGDAVAEHRPQLKQLFAAAATLDLPRGHVPKEVETVLNHRVVNQTQIIAAVSGGVSVEPRELVSAQRVQTDRSPRLQRDYDYARPHVDDWRRWWWD